MFISRVGECAILSGLFSASESITSRREVMSPVPFLNSSSLLRRLNPSSIKKLCGAETYKAV